MLVLYYFLNIDRFLKIQCFGQDSIVGQAIEMLKLVFFKIKFRPVSIIITIIKYYFFESQSVKIFSLFDLFPYHNASSRKHQNLFIKFGHFYGG